jgi:hypothetical protein
MPTFASFSRRLAIGALAGLTLAGALAATAATADARPFHRHHRGGAWIGPAIIGGLALGALAARPYYYGGPAYARRCWIEPRRVINRWGHPVIRRVQVCG